MKNWRRTGPDSQAGRSARHRPSRDPAAHREAPQPQYAPDGGLHAAKPGHVRDADGAGVTGSRRIHSPLITHIPQPRVRPRSPLRPMPMGANRNVDWFFKGLDNRLAALTTTVQVHPAVECRCARLRQVVAARWRSAPVAGAKYVYHYNNRDKNQPLASCRCARLPMLLPRIRPPSSDPAWAQNLMSVQRRAARRKPISIPSLLGISLVLEFRDASRTKWGMPASTITRS